jgi:MinD-like ATPase involved in chromosome partitioning or flagellar assembly
MEPVVGVLGGNGGVGATTFAAVLAAVAGESLLVDLDGWGGGVDVALGVEGASGARWSGLQLAGGRLDPEELLAGLPRWGLCAVLAADEAKVEAEAAVQVVSTAASVAPVVVDLPRAPGALLASVVPRCDVVVALTRSDAPALVATHAVLRTLPEAPVGVIVRRGRGTPADAARLVGARLLGDLPPLAGRVDLDLPALRWPRAVERVARGILGGVGDRP